MKFIIILALFGVALGKPSFSANYTLSYIPVSYGGGNSGKIIGGSDATPGQFPWQISLQNLAASGERYHMCGGTLVDATHVVCAAHCVQGQDASRLQVVVGGHNIQDSSEPEQQRRNVKSFLHHEKYNPSTIVNDVSIIVLDEPVTFNDRVQPLSLPRVAEVEPTNGRCINSGWGNSNPTGGTPVIIPDALQFVELDIIPHATCQLDYFLINVVPKTMICANDNAGGKGACNGDSGGPLICLDENDEYYLAGIVSWGMQPCGQKRFPSVYTHVSHFIDWVVQAVAENN